MEKEIKKIISEQVDRYNRERKIILEQRLNEVEFKLDLLDHDLGYYKKFEKAIKKIKIFLKKKGFDYTKGFGYHIASTKTSSYYDGEGKQKAKTIARLKLDKFDEKNKKANCSTKKTKKDIITIFDEYGLEVVDLKYKENKPEEIIFTIKL